MLALLSILALTACAGNRSATMLTPMSSAAPATTAPDTTTPTDAPAISAKQLAGVNAPAPDSLIGKSGSDLVALLGQPGLVHKEKDGEVWQYAAHACVMLFYLYDNPQGARRITYLEALPQGSASGAAETPQQTCLAYQMLAASSKRAS